MTSRTLYKYVELRDLYPESMENAEYIRTVSLDFKPFIVDIEVDTAIMTQSILNFLHEVFGKDFTQEYLKFLERAIFVPNARSEIISSNNSRKHNRVDKIEIPIITTIDDAATQLHEFMHYLRYTKNPKMCNNLLYNELPSIFIEMLYSYYCDMHFANSKNYSAMLSSIDTRIAVDVRLKKSFRDLSYVYFVGNNPSPELAKEHERYITETLKLCKYFLSTVYAFNLLMMYQEDEKNLRKRFKAIGTGGLTIDQLLKYYNINLCNEEVVDNIVSYIRVRTRQRN
jgi:hypothetical protein